MSEPYRSIPRSRPQTEMLAHVEALLRRDPRLTPVCEAGYALELDCDDEAIWATLAAPASAARVVARMETPRWWLPGRSGRALAIAERLASDLHHEIEPGV